MRKRLLSGLLCLAMMLTLLPGTALAIEPTENDPTVYEVSTTAEFAEVVAAIEADTENGTDFTIVFAADSIDVNGFVGIENKHITLASTEDGIFEVTNMGTTLVGDLTLDNVDTYKRNVRIFANGHLFETTERFINPPAYANAGQPILFGGGNGTDVEGDTTLVLRGGRFSMVYGGGFNGNVSGDVHITLEGNADDDNCNFGNMNGGGSATGANTEKGCVGGNVYLDFISGTLGVIHGGGQNSTTDAKANRETAAKVNGDVFIRVGDAERFTPPTGEAIYDGSNYPQGACLTTVDFIGGGQISSVGNVNVVLENGTFFCQKDDMAQTKEIMGGSVSGIVRGTVDITVNGGYTGGIYGSGQTWSSYGINHEVWNENGEPYAVHITVNGGFVRHISTGGSTVERPSFTPTAQVQGDTLIEMNGGLGMALVLGRGYCTIDGDSTAYIRNGALLSSPSVFGYDYNHAEVTGKTELVFEGSGEIDSNGNDQYLELFQIEDVDHVRLTQNSRVSVSYINFGYRQDNAFDGVEDLTVDAGSVLALDAPAEIKGNLVLNGSFASAREVMDNYAQYTPNGVYPALLTVGGTATGSGEVLTMKPKNWVLDSPWNNEVLLSTPTVGEIYIAAQKAGSDGQFLLQNDEPALFLNRIDQPGQADRYAWQIATGRTVTFDKNGGDTEAAPRKVGFLVSDVTQIDRVNPLPNEPARTGYTFAGWNTQADGEGTAFTNTTDVTTSLTVFAQWAAIPTYTVTYTDGVDGEEVFADQTTSGLASGAQTPAFSGTPTRSGYTFTGWSPAVAATVTANATYTAQWSRNSSGGGGTTYYTLAYESSGGTEYKSERYSSGTTVKLDKVPSRTGYSFTGWYAEQTLTTAITEVKMTSSKTVYAGWRASTVPGMLNGDDHFAYVVGYTDGLVRPLNNITRAEVATIFFRLLKDDVRDKNLTATNTFTDVVAGTWCNKPISTMATLGVVKGRSDQIFDPDAAITRAEFATICARFDTTVTNGNSNFTDISGHWAQADIERAAALGWIQGYTDGTFRPEQYITRAEAMTMINRVLCRIPEDEGDLLKDMIVWPDNQPGVWYYLAVQEATNGHDYTPKGEVYEHWAKLIAAPDWTKYEN